MKLFPKEIVEYTAENYIYSIRTSSQIIYIVVLLCVAAVIGSLPLIHLDVSIQSRGAIRAKTGSSVLASPVSGKIIALHATENQMVKKGDLIAELEIFKLEFLENFYQESIEQIINEKDDLGFLIGKISGDPSNDTVLFKTNFFDSEYREFKTRVREFELQMQFAESQLIRSQQLLEKGLISQRQLDADLYAVDKTASSKNVLIESMRKNWEQGFLQRENKLNELDVQLEQLLTDKVDRVLVAPFDGTIQQIENWTLGSFVQQGQKIALLSAQDDFVAEIYVSPTNIGLISLKSPVSMQVDAFNYREWGNLEGSILDISEDVYVFQNQPVFKVTCSVDQDYLCLTNGAKGHLKKGMTLRARFVVNRRSLFQLLFDELEDWFNPFQIQADRSK